MGRRYFDIGAVCNIGLKKDTNQDRILVLLGEINNVEFCIFAVADGVGGMDFGGVASEYVIYTIKKWWETRIKELITQPVKEIMRQVDIELEDLIQKLNMEIIKYGNYHEQKGGTTLSLMFVYNNSYIIKHTGDSRIYMLEKELVQLTRDQSVVEGEVGKGTLSKVDASINPMRNVLTMCLGIFVNLKLQTLSGSFTGSSVIIICSDGLYRYFSSEEINRELGVLKKDINETAQSTANILLKKVISRGACDNVSLIIANLKEERFYKKFL